MEHQQQSHNTTRNPPLSSVLENKSTSQTVNTSGKKICCACPDSKRARDECIVINGEEACQSFIDAHKACLRSQGFNV